MSEIPSNGKTINVLLIEDDEDDYIITRELLEQVGPGEIQVEWKPDPDEGLAVALGGKHDVILVDYRLGRKSGLEIVQAIRDAGCRTPSILLTGEGRHNLDIEALQKGAADYLSKDEINASLLERSIRYAIERKRSSEVLRESEERFGKLADAVPALIWMADPADRLIFVNQCWLEFRGTSLAGEVGHKRGEGGHPDDDEVVKVMEAAVRRHTGFEVEIRMLRHDGEFRWMLNTGRPIFLPDGTFNGYVGTCIDITERKLASEQLAQGRDQALDNARLKSQFLANMTHEIRTPMNGILGMTSLLQQTNLTQEQRELTESVRSSGQSLLRIIDDILDFSRMEARRLNIDHVPFNLVSVIEDVTELLAESARAKGIELISVIDPMLTPGLLGDSGRMRQILLNLVGNAIKFTEMGEVFVESSLLQEFPDRVKLRIDVKDTGIGIARETQEKLFTAFMQADGSTTRKYGGTGLGLAISKELVELMKGQISVESDLGHGACFRIELMFDKDHDGQQSFERGLPEWRGQKILVIDDNPRQRDVLCRHLSFLGFDCLELAHGSKAVHVIEQESRHGSPLEAVLVDADVASEEALKVIRDLAASGEPRARIVAMPFGFLSDQFEPLRAAGADDFLIKPVRQSQLFPLLERVLASPSPKGAQAAGMSAEKTTFFTVERFLLLCSPSEETVSLQQQIEMLGGKTDLIACASRAIEALKLFHYDAIFYDPVAMGEGTPEVLHQIQDLSSDGSLRDIPLIEVGTKLNTQTQATVLLNGPVTTTDLVEVFRRCRLLPELPRPRSSKLSSEEPEAERTIAEDQVTPILAPERLEELRKLAVEGENVLDDLFLLFREEVPPRVDELRGAVDREDWAAARFSVHAVSGVCLNLGAIRMESLCRRLQTKLDEGQVEGVLELVEAIRLATADVEAALEEAGEQPSDVGLNHRRGES